MVRDYQKYSMAYEAYHVLDDSDNTGGLLMRTVQALSDQRERLMRLRLAYG